MEDSTLTSFGIKRPDDYATNELWLKYVDWLNRQREIHDIDGLTMGIRDLYYGYTVSKEFLGAQIYAFKEIKHLDYVKELLEPESANLAYAKKRYPRGTVYRGLDLAGNVVSGIYKVYSEPRENQYSNIDAGPHWLYLAKFNKWAEIINEVTKEEEKMETQKLSRQGLKEIHAVACSSWKSSLELLGASNPLEDYIELNQDQVDAMFKACTSSQLTIVSEYLKQDDGSVNLSGVGSLVTENGNIIISKRIPGEYANKSFWLNGDYTWEIKTDSKDALCLIPTKKK
jgi:hypothetical protein